MRVILLIIAGLAAAFLGRMAAVVIPGSGALAELSPRLVDQCRRIEIAPGTEDIVVDTALNVAFVSAADRRAWFAGQHRDGADPTGGVYALSLDGTDTVRKVSGDAPAGFFPHGIDLWTGPNGETRLFAVSHPVTGEEIVEIFAVGSNGALTHLESVSFPEMYSPNDVVATGPRSFYASNDQRYDEGVLGQLEAFLGLPLTSVVYWDGERGREAAGRLIYANGVNLSPDGRTLYAAELLGRRIRVYDRDPASGALSPVGDLKVNTAPDNIDVDGDGVLWVAGHSKLFDFLAHAEDPAAISPSHVIRIDAGTGEARDVFISTEGEIKGSSVGARAGETLLVGAVFDSHVMACPL